MTEELSPFKKKRKRKMLPPASFLREQFRYDSATGKLYWRKRPEFYSKGVWGCTGKEAGALNIHGWKTVRIFNEKYLLHRVIWKMVHGVDPIGNIWHKDGDGCNNRIDNLYDTGVIKLQRERKEKLRKEAKKRKKQNDSHRD